MNSSSFFSLENPIINAPRMNTVPITVLVISVLITPNCFSELRNSPLYKAKTFVLSDNRCSKSLIIRINPNTAEGTKKNQPTFLNPFGSNIFCDIVYNFKQKYGMHNKMTNKLYKISLLTMSFSLSRLIIR